MEFAKGGFAFFVGEREVVCLLVGKKNGHKGGSELMGRLKS